MSLKECAAFVGIDWADQQHAICLIDPNLQKPEFDSLDQEPEAIDQWVSQMQQRFPGQKIAVCLEQKRGALIYALMKFDSLILVPVNPKQLARFREALEPSGAKGDPSDAHLLAELVLKHPDRLRIWKPDDEATRKIRFLAEDRRHFVDQRTALNNSLKSSLKQYFPLALKITERISSNLACALLTRYPSLEQLQAASDDELRQFYRDHRCHRQAVIEQRLQSIRQAKPLTNDLAVIESSVLKVQALVEQMIVLNQAIQRYDDELAALMRDHPDAPIFKSFPGAAAVMAPRLLAAMGTDRERLHHAQDVQQVSGIAPVTKQSGKSKVVHRRWACNRFLLQTFHEFAGLSIKQSAWAKACYDMLRANGRKHQAAIRELAFKWIRIILRCWKNRTTYDESVYIASLIQRQSPVVKYLDSNANQSRNQHGKN
jgi:transposase